MEDGLNAQDIEVLLESLEYSKDRIRNASGTPYNVRQQNLARLDAVVQKLRHLRGLPDGLPPKNRST